MDSKKETQVQPVKADKLECNQITIGTYVLKVNESGGLQILKKLPDGRLQCMASWNSE